MVAITEAPAKWDPASVTLFQTRDAVLGDLPMLIFYGPSSNTNNSILNSSRIQTHLYSIAGFRSYPRLTISPTSPLYAAVQHLPEEKQGDETTRGLAISVFKYFEELPQSVRHHLADKANVRPSSVFDAAHAARLVTSLVQSKDASKTASQLMAALAEKHVSWVDVNVVVSMEIAAQLKSRASRTETEPPLPSFEGSNRPLMDLLSSLGKPAFLPTSRLRRAPSRPTGGSKTKTLSPTEVEALQREMMEATETEVTYVKKLQQLEQLFMRVDSEQDQRFDQPDSNARRGQLTQLYAMVDVLRNICHINGEFLSAIVDLMDETSSHKNYGQPNAATPGRHDITGAEAFARVLLAFLPRFTTPYQQYLKLSPHIAQVISNAVECGREVVTSAISTVGEKRLKSWLIEPVQRLPRYTLFADKMLGLLPASHPAVNKFLRIKDLIADICALDSEGTDTDTMVMRRLQDMVLQLPVDLLPPGRLLSAADASELAIPFRSTPSSGNNGECVVLLFSSYIIVVRRCSGSSISACGLMAELQRPQQALSTLENGIDSTGPQQQFVFDIAFQTAHVRLMESDHGKDVFFAAKRYALLGVEQHLGSETSIVTKGYCLQSAFDGRSSKFAEEVARARIENRFPETFRETEGWNFHISGPDHSHLGMAMAIFGPDASLQQGSLAPDNGTIVIDARGISEETHTAEMTGTRCLAEADLRLSSFSPEELRLHGTTNDGRRFIDQAPPAELVPLLLKRVGERVRQRYQVLSPDGLQYSLAFHQKVLEGICPGRRSNSTASRMKIRPISPVKALSSIIGSGVKLSQYLTNPQSDHDLTPNTPTPAPRPVSCHSKPSSDPGAKGRFTVVSSVDAPASGSMRQLEKCFNTYIVALHCRAGNIIGRTLRNRDGADELMVNELYNNLIEDPSQHQAAAEVPVDVLFAAFEKFIAHEWNDRMGPLLPLNLLETMQAIFDRCAPSALPPRIKEILNELSPQNRRVLAATIKLLFDLLEASGNDADRGSLTASFAEALFPNAHAHEFIPLLDRLVDDVDTFFESKHIRASGHMEDTYHLDAPQIGLSVPKPSASRAGSTDRTHFRNGGSVSSTGSSIKKRLGIGMLSRDASKGDSESRMQNVWRTLSKKSSVDGGSSGTGMVVSILSRSKSSDRLQNQRPGSRPGSAHSIMSIQNSPRSDFDSTKGAVHSTIISNGAPSSSSTSRCRQKRRSSLSDLHDLDRCASPFVSNSPIPTRTLPRDKLLQNKTFQLEPTSGRMATIPNKSNVSQKEENDRLRQPSLGMDVKTATLRDGTATSVAVQRNVNAPEVTRLPLSERSMFNENHLEPPSRTPSASSKMRMKIQTSQKLRERTDREGEIFQSTDAQSREKMTMLRNDLNRIDRVKTSSFELRRLEARLSALESDLSSHENGAKKRIAAVRDDAVSSLAMSERKLKKTEKAYQAANVENELLYDRFNDELAKVFQNLRTDGVQAVTAKLREAQLEIGRLKRENIRLKHENINLQSHWDLP